VKDNNLRPILLGVGILLGFVILVAFSLVYIAQEYTVDGCRCAYTMPVIISLLSGTGIFVGILTYYFLSGKAHKEKKEIKKNVEATLSFLDGDERKIVEALLKNKGKIPQAKIDGETGLGRVKAFRVVKKLEDKGIISKERNGKTNNVKLNSDLTSVFLEENA